MRNRKRSHMNNNAKTIIIWTLGIGLALSAGFIGSIFTTPAIPTWYASLNKPFFNPPNWLFAPVWTLLYILMGVASARVFQAKKKKIRSRALWLYAGQLILNTLWSIVFFGLQNPTAALLVIFALLLALIATIINFNKIDRTAGLLLWPYLGWVSFASILNAAIVYLNYM